MNASQPYDEQLGLMNASQPYDELGLMNAFQPYDEPLGLMNASQPYDEQLGLMNAPYITAESNPWRARQPAKHNPILLVVMVKLILCA
jgi:hypothetical protein